MEITIEQIKEKVSGFYNLTVDQMCFKTRKREIVEARQVSMYFAEKHTKHTLAVIGREIGNKDHATVLHAKATVENLIETDKYFRNDIEEINEILFPKKYNYNEYFNNSTVNHIVKTAS